MTLSSVLCSPSLPHARLTGIGSAASSLRGLQGSGNDHKLWGVAGWTALMARKHKESARGVSHRQSRLRLVLADDQTILRHGLRAILDAEPDLQVIGEASNMQDGVALSRRLLPDVLITDVVFSNGIEVQALGQLRRECAGVRVLLLTGHSCQQCMRAAITAGVHGYILKHSPFEVLLRAIHSDGSEYEHVELPLHAMGPKHERWTGESAKAQIAEMTARERQVLVGVALGYSNKRIAGNLGRSVKTIEKHRFKMMHRLGLQNAAAATRYAIDNGLLHDDDEAQQHAPGTEQTARSQRRTRT
jgi:two-component system, NarL family, response regulator NreC